MSLHTPKPIPASRVGAKPAAVLASRQPLLFILLTCGLLPGVLAYALATMNELKVAAALVAMLVVMVILVRPFWGLIFFVALLFTRPEETIPALNGMRLTLILSLVTLAGLFLQLTLNREPLVRHPALGMICGFGIWVVLSTINSGTTLAAATDVSKLVILVVLILNLIRRPETYRALVNALLTFTGYLAVYSLYLYYSGQALIYQGDLERSQATGIFGDPNDLAATIVAALAVALPRILNGKGWERYAYISLSGLYLWAILLTHSRGGLLALLMTIGAFIIFSIRRRALAIMLAAAVGVLFFTFGPSRMTNFDSQEQSANSRFWFWDNGIQQFLDHPFTGVGYGQFASVNYGMVAHNSFVQCFAELGFPGYFFWMGCLYYGYRPRRRRPGKEEPTHEISPEDRDLLGSRLALAGFLAAAFFLTRTYVPVLYLWVCLPIVAQTVLQRTTDESSTPDVNLWLDGVRIAGACVVSIVLIRIITDQFK